MNDNADVSESPLYWSYWLGCIAAVFFLWNGFYLAAWAHGNMRRMLPCEMAPPTTRESRNNVTCSEGNADTTMMTGTPPPFETNSVYSTNLQPVYESNSAAQIYTVQTGWDPPPSYSDLFGNNQDSAKAV